MSCQRCFTTHCATTNTLKNPANCRFFTYEGEGWSDKNWSDEWGGPPGDACNEPKCDFADTDTERCTLSEIAGKIDVLKGGCGFGGSLNEQGEGMEHSFGSILDAIGDAVNTAGCKTPICVAARCSDACLFDCCDTRKPHARDACTHNRYTAAKEDCCRGYKKPDDELFVYREQKFTQGPPGKAGLTREDGGLVWAVTKEGKARRPRIAYRSVSSMTTSTSAR